MYLSGPPLHVLAVHAAARFAEATEGRFGLSFSGGIDRTNFTDTLACGFVPVTTCTDLLRPGGYGRLPKYLKELEARMEAAGVRDVASFVRAQAGGVADAARRGAREPAGVRGEGHDRSALRRARRTTRSRGASARTSRSSTASRATSASPVCPNDANFAVEIAEGTFDAPELVVRGGHVVLEAAPAFVVKRKRQFANYADFCNDCGNCDVFCPEEGGPYKVKPRFFGARATFDADTLDGFFVERDARGRHVMTARMDGGAR